MSKKDEKVEKKIFVSYTEEEFNQVREALRQAEHLLNDRIITLGKTVEFCSARQDPSGANFEQARHAYILYRNFILKAKSVLRMYR
jgi:hypothetical protein